MATNLLKYWQLAKDAKIGISLKTDDYGLLRQQLYRARLALKTDQFAGMTIILPDNPGELWIVHEDADDPSRGPDNKDHPKLVYD